MPRLTLTVVTIVAADRAGAAAELAERHTAVAHSALEDPQVRADRQSPCCRENAEFFQWSPQADGAGEVILIRWAELCVLLWPVFPQQTYLKTAVPFSFLRPCDVTAGLELTICLELTRNHWGPG